MKKLITACVVTGLAIPIGVGASITLGANDDTSCWDEYNVSGTRHYGVLAAKDVPLEDCTPASTCKIGYSTRGSEKRLYVPIGADPATACEELPPATSTTLAPTTSTSVPPTSGGRFATLPPGAQLPGDAECAARVRPMTENRPGNATANGIRGTAADATYPRVTGDFTGTTDEIIQWTACKWGIDEDLVRAQIVAESNWNQTALGDFTRSASACAPGFPIGNYPAQYTGDRRHRRECPESVGLGQVRWLYHQSAFANGDATRSSAYNLDYTYAVWRQCFEGGFGWLNDVEGRGDYAAGDPTGCQGAWFSGRWYTAPAVGYIDRVEAILAARPWEQTTFPPALPVVSAGTPTPTVAPTVTTAAPTSTTTSTLAPPTTAATTSTTTSSSTSTTTSSTSTTTSTTTTTTAPPTTTAPTTGAPGGLAGDFVETFDGNTGLSRFDKGVSHRDDHLVARTSWTGDHDLACGSPDTQRQIRRDRPDESFYLCRDHLMTSVGDTSGYSIAWFSPKQVFHRGEHTTVSWDVNVTDLGNRQWWEVVLVGDGDPFLTTVDWVAQTAQIEAYHPETIAVGKGPFGNDGNIYSGGRSRDPLGWEHVCGSFAVDPEGCSSKAIRRTFSMTDNQNGTITFDFLGKRYTYAGQFPDTFRVYFKDHNYTPDKDGKPVGHTWHWDNIVVR